MTRPMLPQRRRSHPRRAFSLVEVAISMLLIGGLMVASLNAVGAAARSDLDSADRHRGQLLAQDLMAEILQKPYKDPGGTLVILGIDLTPVVQLTRALLKSIDDFANLLDSPPRTSDGTLIPGASEFERRVTVQWVNPTDLDAPSATETGVKRIIVEVRRGNRVVARLAALRTSAAQLPPYQP